MSRRRPRLSECRNIKDFVRCGVLHPVKPTTDSGYCVYAIGRDFQGSGNPTSLIYPTSVFSAISTAISIAVRTQQYVAQSDNTTCPLVEVGASGNSSMFFKVRKSAAGTWSAQMYDGAVSKTSSPTGTWAANTAHVIVARRAAATIDCNADGTSGSQGAGAVNGTGINQIKIGHDTFNANAKATAGIGPVIVSPTTKSAAWASTIVANSGAAFFDVSRLVRDFLSIGDLIIPLAGDSMAYQRVG